MLKNVPVMALLIPIVIVLNANYEVYSFNRSGDKRKCQNSKSGSRDTHMAPFDLILHFVR